jgi:Tfp pilus assembly protein PilN
MNFAGRDYRLSMRLVSGIAAASAVLLIIAAATAWAVLSARNEKAALDRQTVDLMLRSEQVKSSLEERDRLLQDLNAMSGLIEARKFSWTRLLTGIEEVFPTGAALERLQYNPKDRSLVLDGRAQSPEALRNLMVGLEKSTSFKDPLLKHQSVEKGTISFTVGAHYR